MTEYFVLRNESRLAHYFFHGALYPSLYAVNKTPKAQQSKHTENQNGRAGTFG